MNHNTYLNYTEYDFDEELCDLWPYIERVEDVGITRRDYHICEDIHNKYFELEWLITDDYVKRFGFVDLSSFKEVFIKKIVYSALVLHGESTLGEYLDLFYNTVKKSLRNKKYVPRIPDSGNLLDYFMKYDTDMLLTFG